MLLGKSTQTLVVVLGEVKTTTDCDFSVAYVDTVKQAVVKNSQYGRTNGTTIVQILEAPPDNGSHDVEEITLYNADTVTHNFYVKVKDGANYYTVAKLQLTTLQHAIYSAINGWEVG